MSQTLFEVKSSFEPSDDGGAATGIDSREGGIERAERLAARRQRRAMRLVATLV